MNDVLSTYSVGRQRGGVGGVPRRENELEDLCCGFCWSLECSRSEKRITSASKHITHARKAFLRSRTPVYIHR